MSLVLYEEKSRKGRRSRTIKDMIVDETIGAIKQHGPSLVKEYGLPLAKRGINAAVAKVSGLISGSRSGKNGERITVNEVAPLAMSIRNNSAKPKFGQTAGGISVTNTELVNTYSGYAGDYNLQITSTSFPWLSPLAANFEEWRVKYQFGWVPTCPATTSGTVYLAWDYDPADNDTYIDEDYFQVLDHSIGAVWSPGSISPKVSGWLKTDTNGSDSRLFSPGRLHFANATPASGFLMVRYTVELRKPQPNFSSPSLFGGSAVTTSVTSDVFPSVGLIKGDLRAISTIGNNKLQFSRSTKYMVSLYFRFANNPGAANLVAALDIGQTPVSPTTSAIYNDGGYKAGFSYITQGFGSTPLAVTTFAWSAALTPGIQYSYIVSITPLVGTAASP